MANASVDSQVLMARQPIFDAKQRVVAYELLYRSEGNAAEAVFRGNNATSEVLLNAYTSIADEGELKRVPAFINLTYDIVVDGTIPDLPRKQVVLELLEDAPVDNKFIEAVTQLALEGYRIALDDFTYDPKYDPLLKIAHIVKIDVMEHDKAAVDDIIKKVTPFKVTLLAEKIETYEKLEECLGQGFKLFQGHFLSKPQVIKGRKLSTSQLALMQLMQALQQPNVKPDELERLIVQDPILTYKLLRIVNSAANALVRQVDSIKQAIVLLGIPQVKKWVTLIACTSNPGKPQELSRQLLIRGRMAELIAENTAIPQTAGYFMAGMMSGLDALLDLEKQQILADVPLGDDIKEAISTGSGEIGAVLNNVMHFENGDWDLLPMDFDADLYDSAYKDALNWTLEAMQALNESD